MSTPANAIPTEAELEKRSREWNQAEYARALRHLLNQGFGEPRLMQPTSGVLPPLVAVWHFEAKIDGKKQRLWVVTGADLPIDHVLEGGPTSAREALRHFYLHWQLKAAQLEQGLTATAVNSGNASLQANYIHELQRGSERLFQIVNEDRLWLEQQS